MNSGLIAAIMAVSISAAQCRNKEPEDKQKRINNFLLRGGTETMELGRNETIKAVIVYYNIDEKWVAQDAEKIISDSLTECLQMLIKINRAKEIQIVARGVDKYDNVDAYTIFMKVLDEEALEKSKKLSNTCQMLSEELTKTVENWD